MALDIKIDTSDLQRLRKLVGDKVYTQATRSAISKLLDRGRTETARFVSEEYVVKVGAVKRTLTVKKPSFRDLRGAIFATGAPIPLSGFQTRKAKRGVRARVKRGSASRLIPGAFQAGVRYAPRGFSRGVLRRAGKARTPINLLFGPSIPGMVKSEDVVRKIFARWETEGMDVLEREIRGFALRAARKK